MKFLPIIVISISLRWIMKLQVFLSKRENKCLGLILPVIYVVFSIMILITVPEMGDLSVVERNLLYIMIFVCK
jgi:hypothetical protein